MFRLFAAAGLAAALVAGAVGGTGPDEPRAIRPPAIPAVPPSPPTTVVYSAPLPVPLRITRPFVPPATPYGPGHLGVDLRSNRRAVVRAAADGIVRFAGAVAGRGVVVLLHADGISTEYEPLTVLVRAGELVGRNAPIGRLAGRHAGCASWCLHWGARRGAAYLDPLGLLRALTPVRLLPWPRNG